MQEIKKEILKCVEVLSLRQYKNNSTQTLMLDTIRKELNKYENIQNNKWYKLRHSIELDKYNDFIDTYGDNN